ncbi:MAG TPA: SAM-dependent methyltransferase [Amycolatopsis sp.]|uniref:SAM-dependent methyltransferase n=1 Tax=Amycolatopsis sp. TaxID=37632 RepID=UPI002B45BDBC|nr:SAM-dependent methyltransferase [Amycolatopsis sp.]HKS49829.1 SAM-dependent methyltransferase [Amycolatopsis sp.]
MESFPAPRRADLGTLARVRTLWLDGSVQLTETERAFEDVVLLVAPHIPHLVREQHAMLGRVVRYLAGQGIRQFLDLGSGLLTSNHIHDIAQATDPECRVVYVDNEPTIAADGTALVAGNDRVAYLCADIRQPKHVLATTETRRLIDFDQPVAVLLIETLLHIPDSDNPDAMVSKYVEATTPGSYLGISQFKEGQALREAFAREARMFGPTHPPVTLRSPERQADFFTGLELVEPGIVPVQLWRPDEGDIIDRNPELTEVYAGLARKP